MKLPAIHWSFFSLSLLLVEISVTTGYAQVTFDVSSSPPPEITTAEASEELVVIPLPVLNSEPRTAKIPSSVGADSFGLPPFELPKKEDDVARKMALKKGLAPPGVKKAPVGTGEMGKIIYRLPINGSLPGKEILMGTYTVPLGGTFAVKVEKDKILFFLVKEISATTITFGWSKDSSIYNYQLSPDQLSESYVEDVVPERRKNKS